MARTSTSLLYDHHSKAWWWHFHARRSFLSTGSGQLVRNKAAMDGAKSYSSQHDPKLTAKATKGAITIEQLNSCFITKDQTESSEQ